MGQFDEHELKECKCCYDEKDQSGQTNNEPINSINQSLDEGTYSLKDRSVCHKGCAACCHEFDHQYCANPETCRHNASKQSIDQPLIHSHDGLRQRFAYKPTSSKSQLFSLASPSVSQSGNQLINQSAVQSTDEPIYKKLSFVDRYLSLWILLTMVIGVLVGYYEESVSEALHSVSVGEVSLPVAFGLWFMMAPVLVKVKYESFVGILKRKDVWKQMGFSLLANWLIGPFIMLAVSWICLPDLDAYRNGVIMVGLARCIAMVLIWNELAAGDPEYCAMLVAVNSIMQIALYAPLAVFFLVVISGQYSGEGESLSLDFWDVFKSVLLFLGVPLAAAIIVRYGVIKAAGREWFETKFVRLISPLSLIALLWTVFAIFVIQGHNIVENIGDVCRVSVPMVLYFLIMFGSSLAMSRYFGFGYERSVTQAFTASSNNFELAIAVAAATFGVNSEEALAATIGPLVEVPVLLALVYVALWLKPLISWPTAPPSTDAKANEVQLTTQCP